LIPLASAYGSRTERKRTLPDSMRALLREERTAGCTCWNHLDGGEVIHEPECFLVIVGERPYVEPDPSVPSYVLP
jgi:hypothetical protein